MSKGIHEGMVKCGGNKPDPTQPRPNVTPGGRVGHFSIDDKGYVRFKGACPDIAKASETQFWREREAYRKAFEAAQSILSLAELFAEGETSHGRLAAEELEQAKAAIAEALKGIE